MVTSKAQICRLYIMFKNRLKFVPRTRIGAYFIIPGQSLPRNKTVLYRIKQMEMLGLIIPELHLTKTII